MKIRLSTIIKSIVSIIVVGILYWFMLPPLNWRSTDMWAFIAFCIVICAAINFTHKIIELIAPHVSGRGVVVKKDRISLKG